jgi:hypothetical protein
MNYELIELGNNCLPYELKKIVLQNKSKTLFMLGCFNFNNICKFLENGIFEDIINKEHLFYENKKIEFFTNEYEKYYHNYNIKNSKYNFIYNHDFMYDISSNTIQNYDFIENEFNNKIKNLKHTFVNEKIPIFINFTTNMKKEELQIEKMISVLKKYINKQFYILTFLNSKINQIEESKNECVKYIYLEEDFSSWWNQPKDIKLLLYKEMYEKYVIVMKETNFETNFIPFEELNIIL